MWLGLTPWRSFRINPVSGIGKDERGDGSCNKILVPLTVFIETFVALLVFKRFVECNDWGIALCYCLGSALGSLVPMLIIGEQERGRSGRAGESTSSRSPKREDFKEVSHAG